jgi:hypothetical protein
MGRDRRQIMADNSVPEVNPRLKDLEFLVGAWEMELSHAAFLPHPTDSVRGQVSFEWLERGAFLLMRMGTNALWLISRDDAQPLYTVFYFDARSVSRVYTMDYSNRVWTMWRDSEQFSQRFTGYVSEDETTITAEWTRRSEDHEWEHDFDVTYRRMP